MKFNFIHEFTEDFTLILIIQNNSFVEFWQENANLWWKFNAYHSCHFRIITTYRFDKILVFT